MTNAFFYILSCFPRLNFTKRNTMKLISNVVRYRPSINQHTYVKYTFNELVSANPFYRNLVLGQRRIHTYRLWATNMLERTNDKTNGILLHIGKQCIAVGSQRTKKMFKVEDMIRLCHRCKQIIVDSFQSKTALTKMKSRLTRGLLLSSVAFHWKGNDDTLNRISEEMALLPDSPDATVQDLDEVLQKSLWEKSIDLPDLIGWRRLKDEKSGLYEYKLFCRFYDISAKSFYESQIDLDYRKTWDDRVVELDVIDRDDESEADVLRWVCRFPWPMTSREYIFVRRAKIDREKHTIILMNHSLEHPKHENTQKKDCVRVEHYTSDWIIRSHTSFEENGFDFILTYFDDPKGSYPSSAVKWVANKGVPGYVKTMHDAAKKYQDQQQSNHQETYRKAVPNQQQNFRQHSQQPLSAEA